jgi:hypothetical protein
VIFMTTKAAEPIDLPAPVADKIARLEIGP